MSNHNRAITVGDGGYASDGFKHRAGEDPKRYKEMKMKSFKKKAQKLTPDQLAAAIKRCEEVVADKRIPSHLRNAAAKRLRHLIK